MADKAMKIQRPADLCGPHDTRKAAIDEWHDATPLAGRNARRVAVKLNRREWYAFTALDFETPDEARDRLIEYFTAP